MKEILEKIKSYDSIIINTHVFPDMDALGSQLGLREILRDHFPTKNIYATGPINSYNFDFNMDEIDDEIFKDSLVLVLDTGNKERIGDQRYALGKEIIKIDHHEENNTFGVMKHVDTMSISTCNIIVTFARTFDLTVSAKAADWLFAGIVTDSGRFLYHRTDESTFDDAAYLIHHGANIDALYPILYASNLEEKRLHGHVLSNFIVEDGVAYMKYEKDFVDQYTGDFSFLKSGTINLMSNIEGINIWCTFTEYENKIYVELRGFIPVVDIAIKHGGGGHKFAAGTAVQSWDDIDVILNELKELASEAHTK